MSAHRGRPEVIGAPLNDVIDPKQTSPPATSISQTNEPRSDVVPRLEAIGAQAYRSARPECLTAASPMSLWAGANCKANPKAEAKLET